MTPPLALTQGDPAGIGLELALAAWQRRLSPAPFILIGNAALLRRRAALLGLDVPVVACAPEEAAGLFPDALPVLDVHDNGDSAPGKPDPASAPGTIAAIETAVALTRAGRASAVVTNPIAKSVLYAAGFAHPGHTEFLAALCAGADGAVPHPVMMIWSEELAVVPATIHIPLRDVPAALTAELLERVLRITAGDYARRFGVARPRIAVAGLNPHAGEGGSIGREDAEIIAPVIGKLRAEGLDLAGPLPADTMFHARARAGYDVAVTMYHDQGLIPAKTLAFDSGVNLTLGLPIIRTSPDHGTAFDIAGRGVARPDSLAAALALAARLAAQEAGSR